MVPRASGILENYGSWRGVSIGGAFLMVGTVAGTLARVADVVAVAGVGIAAFVWWALAIPMLRGNRRLRGLASAPALADARLPTLTIISAARNEAARVESAVRSLLTQDLPTFELIVVDDRSTDGTGEILDRLATQDPRLRVLHITELPAGWLGKCHALARAAAEAKGDWVLFTDGDVWMASDAARRALSLAKDLEADHLAVSADLDYRSWGERIFIGYFSAMFVASQRPWDAPNPRSKAHIGIGAFNLVRRGAYERAGGHERLRMEVLDDMALGLIVKESGARSWFAFHDGYVRVRWHEGVGGLVRGVEKNAFAALGYRAGATIAAVAFQFTGTLAPFVGWLLPGAWPKVFAVGGLVGLFLLYRGVARNARLAWWDFVLAPAGAALFSYAILRSMAITIARRGITWRDTRYDIETLRRGRVR